MARLDGYLPLIAQGVKVMHRRHASQGWFEGHALIRRLSQNHNAELNEIYELYDDASDREMTGDQQIGKSLYKFGQEKMDNIVTNREITTPRGNRDGRCAVTRWRISPRTTKALDDWITCHVGVDDLDDLSLLSEEP